MEKVLVLMATVTQPPVDAAFMSPQSSAPPTQSPRASPSDYPFPSALTPDQP